MPQTLPLLDPEILERINGLSLTARRVVEGAMHGLHRSPRHGLSIEFAQHRQYTPGDELKHLDWRVLAKNDRYVIKQYEQETNLRALIVVDASASMGFGGPLQIQRDAATLAAPAANNASTETKFHFASVIAASLGYLLLHQGDSVGLMTVAEDVQKQIPPRAAPNHIMSLSHTLITTTPTGRTNLPGSLHQLAAGLRRRSLIVLVSDLLDDPKATLDALGQVHHAGHEVIVFHVLDPREIKFDLGQAGQGVTILRDMETNEEFEAEPALIRKFVEAEIARFLEEIDDGARRHGLHLTRCSTAEPAHEVLTQYLQSRSAKHL